MDIDQALREARVSIGGGHVHVATHFATQAVTLTVGEDKVVLSGINELLTAVDLLGRVAYEARNLAESEEERR